MKIKRENQRDEDATSVISSNVRDMKSNPKTMNNDKGGIPSFFRSKASSDQFTKIKQEKGY